MLLGDLSNILQPFSIPLLPFRKRRQKFNKARNSSNMAVLRERGHSLEDINPISLITRCYATEFLLLSKKMVTNGLFYVIRVFSTTAMSQLSFTNLMFECSL